MIESVEGLRDYFRHLLAPHELLGVDHGTAGLGELQRGSTGVDVVLTDIEPWGCNAFQLLDWVRVHDPGLPVIVFACYASDASRSRLAELGAFACLEKSCPNAEVKDTVARAIGQRRRLVAGPPTDGAAPAPRRQE